MSSTIPESFGITESDIFWKGELKNKSWLTDFLGAKANRLRDICNKSFLKDSVIRKFLDLFFA